jgi:hypothetical protein
MNTDITILIPTSPIPSHPSTAILDETIANIRKYTDAKIIVMFDGIHSSLEHRSRDYIDYRMLVMAKKYQYGDFSLVWFPEHLHQSMMTDYVIQKMVKTPLIMFCEHDTSPIGEIPFDEICEVVKQSLDVNYVRFNIFHKILDEHKYLMLDEVPFAAKVGYENSSVVYEDVKLTRTIQWSQRPHIAKTEWYLKILGTFFVNKKSMIEDVMHSVVQDAYTENGRDIFGLTIYTPDGNQLRSYHSDGRGGDVKIIDA